jgi:hypothetical protein
MSGVRAGYDELRVVAGYASPSMISRLYSEAKSVRGKFSIQLIIGMTGLEGVGEDSHRRYLDLLENPPESSTGLSVQYVSRPVSVHSKLYIWRQVGQDKSAWMGSANFTQNGFGIGRRGADHRELLQAADLEASSKYFAQIEAGSVDASHPEVENQVVVRAENYHSSYTNGGHHDDAEELDHSGRFANAVFLPLVKLVNPGRGEVHEKSGLNWGQRPEYGREPNQAYIPVPARVSRTGFFPPAGVIFRVRTTDGKLFLMRVAQQGDKALETPDNNSYIGEYFRRVLGLANGAKVDTQDLQHFGSRFVAFHKLDEGLDDPVYVMEYSPALESLGAKIYDL